MSRQSASNDSAERPTIGHHAGQWYSYNQPALMFSRMARDDPSISVLSANSTSELKGQGRRATNYCRLFLGNSPKKTWGGFGNADMSPAPGIIRPSSPLCVMHSIVSKRRDRRRVGVHCCLRLPAVTLFLGTWMDHGSWIVADLSLSSYVLAKGLPM